MCYAAPGPRCYGHASKRLQKAREKSSQLQIEFEKAVKDKTQFAFLNYFQKDAAPINEKLDAMEAKITSVHDSLMQQSRKIVVAEADMDATKGGLERLQAMIGGIENSGDIGYDDIVTLKTLKRRQRNAHRKYYQSIEDYRVARNLG